MFKELFKRSSVQGSLEGRPHEFVRSFGLFWAEKVNYYIEGHIQLRQFIHHSGGWWLAY